MDQTELNQLEVVQDAASRGVTAEIDGDLVILFDGAGYTLPARTMYISVDEIEQVLQDALEHPFYS